MSYYLLALLAGACAFSFARWWGTRDTPVALGDEFILSAYRRGERRTMDVVTGAFGCVLAVYLMSGKILFSLPFAAGGLVWAALQERKRKKSINKKMQDQFLHVLSNLMATMQGGINPYQALSDVTPSLPSPAREVFLEVLRRHRLGTQALPEVLEQMAIETGWEDLRALAMVYGLYGETGANLVEVLKHLSDSVYERKSDAKYIEAVTAQVRTTALILSVIPFILITAMRLVSPGMVEPMFSTFGGVLVFFFIVGMVVTGNIVINRMVAKTLE